MLPAAGSLPAQLNRGPGTTLGQVEQLLTGQPVQDGVVLPPAWRHTLQEERAGTWQMESSCTGCNRMAVWRWLVRAC
jgi:hypothetical protein